MHFGQSSKLSVSVLCVAPYICFLDFFDEFGEVEASILYSMSPFFQGRRRQLQVPNSISSLRVWNAISKCASPSGFDFRHESAIRLFFFPLWKWNVKLQAKAVYAAFFLG